MAAKMSPQNATLQAKSRSVEKGIGTIPSGFKSNRIKTKGTSKMRGGDGEKGTGVVFKTSSRRLGLRYSTSRRTLMPSKEIIAERPEWYACRILVYGLMPNY